ncbi:MAG: hypothetical protein GY842_14195, partial [bacterium]|nr:hypothetical protein [bacterium]
MEQSSAYPAAEIVSASGLPSPMSGRAVKLNPRAGTAGDIPQGARGPRTRDEQPGMAASGDAGMEYWEVDVVVDEEPTSDGGDVMFVVWNMCDVFLNDDFGVDGVPACFSNTAPTCYRVTGGASSASVYARFNAGVRFRRWLGGDTKVETLSNGGWSQIVNGFHSRWYPDTVEHVNIRIDNN